MKSLFKLHPKYQKNLRIKSRRLFPNQQHFSTEHGSDIRVNTFGLQMLPDYLHKQIFKKYPTSTNLNKDCEKKLESAIQHLKSFDLWGKKSKVMQNIEFDLPQLQGDSPNEHFIKIAQDQTLHYAEELSKLVNCCLPPKPNSSVWKKKPGWTKYVSNLNGHFEISTVDCPDDGALIFDCEVLASHSDLPIIAVAVSCDAWYSWTSDHVVANNKELTNDIEYLIPMELKKANAEDCETQHGKLIIGHNVAYDRARIKEQYFLEQFQTRFLDTMSMHIAASGFSFQQRMSARSIGKEEDNATIKSSWLEAGSLNSLAAIHEHYCGETLDKTKRETFSSGSLDDVIIDFNLLMNYCAEDVKATFNVLKKLVPLFFACFPHVVTFAGMIELGQMYLPINNNWNRYIQACQQEYDNLNLELNRTLIDLMNDACHLLKNEKYKEDGWLWDLDWSAKHIKMIKNPRKGFISKEVEPVNFKQCYNQPINLSPEEALFLGKKSSSISLSYPLLKQTFETANRLPLVSSHFPGAPAWYKELQMKESNSSWNLDACNLSTLTRATPKLLRLTWLGYPLHYYDKLGWGYLVPSNQTHKNHLISQAQDDYILEEIEDSEHDVGNSNLLTPSENVTGLPNNCSFHRLPHKNGLGNNVGSPLSHDFIQHIEQGRLSSVDHANAHRCLEINKLSSYWRSSWKRIFTQMKMHLDPKYLPDNVTNHDKYRKDLGYGAIVPQVVVCGTISRRATERTWLTASNTEFDRIGSELKSMIQAPAGYCFVGADVDSQELWIASLLGDASFIGEHGCTALSWMTVEGNKKDGTDLHSKTAEAIGMTRSEAKVFNYARMYGAGRAAALRNYMQHNPGISLKESTKRINQLYEMTKGKHIYRLSSNAQWIIRKANVQISDEAKQTNFATFDEVMKIKNAAHYAFGESKFIQSKDLIAGKKWYGGIESHMFNKLEEIAMSSLPQTPVLKCQISKALLPSKVGFSFLPSRMNWVVQSSAVDYLHLLTVAMRWLINKYKLDARFVLSIHDEVHYLASEKHQYQVTLALQISNLLTRCMFAHQLSMNDLPFSTAFFSSVEIDKVIRKEATDDCITPSNRSGLKAKYGIPFGKTLDIYDILEITDGKFIKPNHHNK